MYKGCGGGGGGGGIRGLSWCICTRACVFCGLLSPITIFSI